VNRQIACARFRYRTPHTKRQQTEQRLVAHGCQFRHQPAPEQVKGILLEFI